MIRRIINHILITTLSIFSNDILVSTLKRRPQIKCYDIIATIEGRALEEIHDGYGPSTIMVVTHA